MFLCGQRRTTCSVPEQKKTNHIHPDVHPDVHPFMFLPATEQSPSAHPINIHIIRANFKNEQRKGFRKLCFQLPVRVAKAEAKKASFLSFFLFFYLTGSRMALVLLVVSAASYDYLVALLRWWLLFRAMDVCRVRVAWCGVCLCFCSNGMMSGCMISSECRENKG